MREVEFLPEWYPKVRQRRRMVALQTWVTLILIAGLGLWMILVQRNVNARQAMVDGLTTDLSHTESQLRRLEDLLAMQRQLGQQNEIFMKIGRPMETSRVLAALSDMMPRDMALLAISLDSEEAPKNVGKLAAKVAAEKKEVESKLKFRMQGVAPTDVDLAEFIAKLTSKPFFKNVELNYSHERQDSGRVMREFEVAFAMDLAGLGGH